MARTVREGGERERDCGRKPCVGNMAADTVVAASVQPRRLGQRGRKGDCYSPKGYRREIPKPLFILQTFAIHIGLDPWSSRDWAPRAGDKTGPHNVNHQIRNSYTAQGPWRVLFLS